MSPEDRADAGAPATEDPARIDAAFDAISDVRRRYALYYLREAESTDLDELATVLAGWRGAREDPADPVSPADRRRLRLELHHAHLPALAAAGYVRYDADAGDVELGRLPPFLGDVLDRSLAAEPETVEPDLDS